MSPRRALITQPIRRALAEPVYLWSRAFGNASGRVPILAYHSVASVPGTDVETVAPGDFEAQMGWLAREGFAAVSVSHAVTTIHKAASHRTVALSFDDGYRDNLTTALPILGKHGFHATVYIPTRHIGGVSSWDGSIGHRPLLSSAEIVELVKRDIEVGSHGHSHFDMTVLGAELLDAELARSREILESIVRAPVRGFAAPFGRWNATLRERVAAAGYQHMVIGGRFAGNPRTADVLSLRRITVGRGDSLREFAKKVSGAYQWLSSWDRP